MSALPDEVVQLLSTAGEVKLISGFEADACATGVVLAPLNRQLYALILRGSRAEEVLNRTGRVEIKAECRDPEWTIRILARGVAGRGVLGDARRAELMHWLPDHVSPAALLAARIYPEYLEYSKGRGSDRTRAAGPVPGAAPPAFLARWARLGTDRVVVWLFPMIALQWLSLLVLLEDVTWRPVAWLVMAGAATAMLGGVTLWNQHNLYVRWREGLATDAAAARMLEAWEPPGRVRTVGIDAMLVGFLLASVAGLLWGWEIGMASLLSSGLPLLLPFHGIRHAMRRSDADRPERADPSQRERP